MNAHLRAGLIALVSLPIAVVAAGAAAAVGSPGQPEPAALTYTMTDPTPAVSAEPSVDPYPTTRPVDPRPITNLTAVVDPVAIPVRGGFQVRVGVRNSGPRSITAPSGEPAVRVFLFVRPPYMMGPAVRPLGQCEMKYRYGPNPAFPPEPAGLECLRSQRTLRVEQTHWESFIFDNLPGPLFDYEINVWGYAQDTDGRDNNRKVRVRAAKPGTTLPVTGTSAVGIAGGGLSLIIAGVMAIWYGRRRRHAPPE